MLLDRNPQPHRLTWREPGTPIRIWLCFSSYGAAATAGTVKRSAAYPEYIDYTVTPCSNHMPACESIRE